MEPRNSAYFLLARFLLGYPIPKHALSPELVFKDTYVLDFLGLSAPYSEATLEQAIVGRVQEFILEMGGGFAFLDRQKRISVDATDHYLCTLPRLVSQW